MNFYTKPNEAKLSLILGPITVIIIKHIYFNDTYYHSAVLLKFFVKF